MGKMNDEHVEKQEDLDTLVPKCIYCDIELMYDDEIKRSYHDCCSVYHFGGRKSDHLYL